MFWPFLLGYCDPLVQWYFCISTESLKMFNDWFFSHFIDMDKGLNNLTLRNFYMWHLRNFCNENSDFNQCVVKGRSISNRRVNLNFKGRKYRYRIRGFQYFSSVPVLCSLQAVLYIKIWTFTLISYATFFKIKRHQRPF